MAAFDSMQPMRVFVTGGSGVLGRAAIPRLRADGHDVVAPRRTELDLFDPQAVNQAVVGADVIYHLATRIPADGPDDREVWRENDRLRAEASRLLTDAGLKADVGAYIQPTVTFVYPDGPVDEETPIGAVPVRLESALIAEQVTLRFADEGRTGVVLRLGLLYGPGTRLAEPNDHYGATLYIDDAGAALIDALQVPSGVYNVCRDGERVSNARFKRVSGWRPTS
jgi:nucleoside-diphosphate-sugar epimerase